MSHGETLAANALDVDEQAIAMLTDTFYRRVRADALLAPVFERAIGVTEAEWTGHLALLRSFWSSVMPTSGRYHGNPQTAHMALPDLNPRMFARWLALFRGAWQELFAPAVADKFIGKAERIAVSLQRGLSPARGDAR